MNSILPRDIALTFYAQVFPAPDLTLMAAFQTWNLRDSEGVSALFSPGQDGARVQGTKVHALCALLCSVCLHTFNYV